MSDIIQLLPDSVANQIAAGEVIQRPASVVKELMENAVDAGATDIRLIVKDAGKTLIQVIDNGCGMSDTDARLSLERHATSKIREANDLFSIRTMGFRGEAMASIAAIAQMEIRTRLTDQELGTCILAEGSTVKSQEACQTAAGTSIAVKSLFFNVPARRKFLKSDAVEIRHIIDEFQRVAMAYPDIALSLHHNGQQVFQLERGSFRQRVVGIFGKNYNQRLVPVEESTNIVQISGFVGKPEAARKTRGEQFFFVNNRFIKSPYLHHAVQRAFEELIPKDHYASYFLKLEVDPTAVDINIHPTKTEIKFEDEKAIYAIIRSATRQSLGKYNIAPSLDFEQETSFSPPLMKKGQEITPPTITVNPEFNPFDEEKKVVTSSYPKTSRPQPAQWEPLYEGLKNVEVAAPEAKQQVIETSWEQEEQQDKENRLTYQLHKKYVLTHIKSGFMIIHQQRAHERILFERYLGQLENQKGFSQQQLFPETVELSSTDSTLLNAMMDDVNTIGFDINSLGNNTFVIQGIPADVEQTDARTLLDSMLESYKQNEANAQIDKRENLARSLASCAALRTGRKMETQEMNELIDQLFACEMPYVSPSGKPTINTITLEDLEKRFG